MRSSSSIGEQPCSAWHSSSSRRCSWAWTWRTSRWRSEYSAIASSQSLGTARTLCAAIPTRTPGTAAAHSRSRLDPAQERVHVGVAEPALSRRRRQIARRPSRRGDRRPAAARSAARPRPPPPPPRTPSRCAPDTACRPAGGARSETRRPRRSRRRPSRRTSRSASWRIVVGIEAAGQPEHLGPPGPEVVVPIAAGPFGAAPQRALERVGMGVRHGRDGGPRGHATNSSARATTRAAIAASSRSTVSAGEWLTPVGLRTNSMAAGTRSASTPASCPA